MSVCDCHHCRPLPFRLCSSLVCVCMLHHKKCLLRLQMSFAYQLLSHLMRKFPNSSRPSCRRWHLRGGPRQTAQPFWCCFDDVPNCPHLSTPTRPSARLICSLMRGWKPTEMLRPNWGIPASACVPGPFVY